MDDIKHFMSKSSESVDSKATVLETIKLMRDKKVGSLLVTENSKFVGIFTETDFLRKVAAEEEPPDKTQVSSVMSSPLETPADGENRRQYHQKAVPQARFDNSIQHRRSRSLGSSGYDR